MSKDIWMYFRSSVSRKYRVEPESIMSNDNHILN